jgi:hypothetical protein
MIWGLQVHRGRPARDIVDMFCDDGITPKEALEIEKIRAIDFLGRDILRSEVSDSELKYAREQEKMNISQDNLGKWHWESPYYEVSTSRGFSSQSQALNDAQRFLAEQRGEIEHEI